MIALVDETKPLTIGISLWGSNRERITKNHQEYWHIQADEEKTKATEDL